MLKRFFYLILGLMIGIFALWQIIKISIFEIPYCTENNLYLITTKGFSLDFGEKKAFRLNLDELTIEPQQSVCEISQGPSYVGWVSWVFDWLEIHIVKLLAPRLQLDGTTILLHPDFQQAELTTQLKIFDSFSNSPWESFVDLQYHDRVLQLRGEGAISCHATYHHDGSFKIEHFKIAKKDLWELQMLNTQGVLQHSNLANLSGGVNLKILDSDIATLYYDYHPPKFTLFRGNKKIGEGHIQGETIEARGLLPLYDVDVSFMGSTYSFKKIDWRSFLYDSGKQFGKVSFADIQMNGLIPLTVDKVDCEGELLNGSGVCHIGKVAGPQGVTMEGFNIVISGFNDLAGSFQGTINPAQWLPIKIPFLNPKDFLGSFMKNGQDYYLLLQPHDQKDELLKMRRVFYQQQAGSLTRWVLEADFNGTPFVCQNKGERQYQCFLSDGLSAPQEDHDIFTIEPKWQENSVVVQLPSSYQHWTDIADLQFNFLDPTLWRFEATNHQGRSAGQIQIAFDEGPADITQMIGELWDMGFQGAFSFDDTMLSVTAEQLHASFLYDLYQALYHSGLDALWDEAQEFALPEALSCQVKHFDVAGHDFGKVQLSYTSSDHQTQRRWTLIHPSLRAQLIEKAEQDKISEREAVVHIDNLSFLAPVVSQLAQVAKGQLIINYHQHSAQPDQHFFYVAGNDIFLKNSACQQLNILNVLSGYAFSPAQFQALLTDGWLIDRITAQGFLGKGDLILQDAHVQSGATCFHAEGSYAYQNDLLAVDLLIQPKISQALPSMAFALGPLGAGIAFAGVQLFGSGQLDKMNEHKWQLQGSLQAPEIKPWEAQVIDLRSIAGEDSGAKDVVVLQGSGLKKVIHQEAG